MWVCTEVKQKLFKDIKNIPSKEILSFLRFDVPLNVNTDMINYQLREVLSKDKKQVKLFQSKLTETQKRHTTT